MFANRTWLRVCIVAGFILAPVWVMLEEGVGMAVVSAVTTLLVLFCAAVAVYTTRTSESEADSDDPSIDSSPPEPWRG
jgi:hypothetical protein